MGWCLWVSFGLVVWLGLVLVLEGVVLVLVVVVGSDFCLFCFVMGFLIFMRIKVMILFVLFVLI